MSHKKYVYTRAPHRH